jgi:putative peptidoglycan lipid II flippase
MIDSTNSIIHSAKRFFSGTVLSRIAGMFRDMAMAYAFGAHASVAAFLVAFRFAHLLRRLLGEGALQSALIPQFEKLRQENMLNGATFFRNLTTSLSVLLSFIVIGTMAILWGVLSWSNLSNDNAEIVQLTLWMMPSLLFICLFGVNASLLQCEKNYFIPSVAPVAFNLVWILGAFVLWNKPQKEAMLWLTLFVNAACAAQWAMTVPSAIKILKKLGLNSFTKIKLFSKDVLGLLGPLSLGVIGVGASQINNALDSIFARYADVEGPAYLWYAIRLQQLPLALFGIAISGAMLPPLSRAIKAGDLQKFKEFLDYALGKTALLIIPITFALFVLGDSGINLLYGHGDFDNQAAAGTTLCLWAYGLGLFPMAVVLLLAPAFYAQHDYKTPTRASIISIAINIFLNFLLVAVFNKGAASVALATSVSAWVNMFLLGSQLHKSCHGYLTARLKQNIVQTTLFSLLASVCVLGYNSFVLPGNTILMLLEGDVPHWQHGIVQQLLDLGTQAVLFFGIMGITLLVNKKVTEKKFAK